MINVSSGFFGARSAQGICGWRRFWDPQWDVVVWRFAKLIFGEM